MCLLRRMLALSLEMKERSSMKTWLRKGMAHCSSNPVAGANLPFASSARMECFILSECRGDDITMRLGCAEPEFSR